MLARCRAPGRRRAARTRPPARLLALLTLTVLLLTGAATGTAAAARAASEAPTAPVACTIYWTGAASADWADAGNWSLSDGGPPAGRAPEPGDVVCMSSAPSTATVDLGADTTASIAELDWPAAADVQPSLTVDGSLTLTGDPSIVRGLTLVGTLIGPGSLTVTGPATLDGATLSSSAEDHTRAGLILQGTTTATAAVVTLHLGAEIENEGTLNLDDGASLQDADGTGNQLINDAGATIAFDGTDSTQTASLEVPGGNAGLIEVGGGTLAIVADGVDSGSFRAASGATLDLGGYRTEEAGATLAGAGTIDITGQTALDDGSTVNPGSFQVDGVVGIGAGGSLTAPNLTLNGDFQGPGTLTVTGTTRLRGDLGVYVAAGGARPGGRLILEGDTVASGDVVYDGGSTLENEGALTLSDNTRINSADGDGNTIVNDAGATITYAGSDSTQTALITVPTSNAGTISVTRGTLDISGADDTGTYRADAGTTLSLQSGTEEPTATITGAGTIQIAGEMTFTAAGNLTATGTFEVSSVLDVAGGATVQAPNLTMVAGYLEGPGTLAVAGPARLDAASVGFDRDPAKPAHLILEGATTQQDNLTIDAGSELENAGTMTLSDNSVIGANADPADDTFVNDAGATIDFAGTNADGHGSIDVATTNDGTITSTTGRLALDQLTNESSGGTLTGGAYTADGGVLDLPAAVTVNAADVTLGASPSSALNTDTDPPANALATLQTNSGSLSLGQSLSLTQALTNSGTLAVDDGALLKAPAYTQTAAGTLTIPIDSATTPSSVGLLAVTGRASLAGTLNLTVPNGTPAAAPSAFTIVTASPVAGSPPFSQVNQPAPAAYTVSASTSSVIVSTGPATGTPSPTVTAVTPATGPLGGGTTVTLTGSHFSAGMTVAFGTSKATKVTVTSATQATAVAPAHLPGTVAITATTTSGTSATSAADRYTYALRPIVLVISPRTGPAAGGTRVTIIGLGLRGASVAFGATPAASVTVVSSAEVVAVAPPESAGVVDVRVTTPVGASATSALDKFTFTTP